MDWFQQILEHLQRNRTLGIVIFILLAIICTFGATKLAEKGGNMFLVVMVCLTLFILYKLGFLDVILNNLQFLENLKLT